MEILHCVQDDSESVQDDSESVQDDSESVQDDSESVQDGKKTTVIPTERSDEGPPSGYSYCNRLTKP